ncbi:MAG: PAS domain S-box protein [Cyanobacteria bacterium SZAS LIN-2]|nr:PAS domain S-box protein [Cyanobacteria bacterium SZAS LIN-2]
MWLSDRVTVEFVDGVPTYLRGVSTDVSERRRIEEALALVVEVIAEASELENVEDISLHCLTRICQLGNWMVGQAWFPSIDGETLKCSKMAYFSNIKAAAFREESLATTFAMGQGLPGQTAHSAFPVFVDDLSIESRKTLSLLENDGIKAGFAFAVKNGQKVFAVFEFYGPVRTRPDKYFLNAIEEIGTHLAVVFERRIAQEMLMAQRAHEQTILDAIPSLVFYKDRNNSILRVNQATADLHGKTPSEMVGMSCFDLYPGEAVKYFQDDLQVMNSGIAKLGIVEPLITPDGQKNWVVTDKIPYRDEHGEIQGVLCFCSDITQLKRVEEELKIAHAELENKVAERTKELNEANIFFTLSRDLFCIASPEGYFKRVNFAWVDRLGYSEEELISRPFISFVHHEDREKTLQQMGSLSDGMPVTNFENRYVCKDGSTIWLLWSATPNTARDFIYACAYDITDRKATEADLLDISTALQNAVEGIAKVDINHCFLSVNQSYAQLHGVDAEAIIERSILEYVYSDDLPKFRRCFEEMLRNNKSEVELLGRTSSGALFHEQVTLVKVLDVHGDYSGYYVFNKDITARKVAEATLQQSEARYSQLASHVPGGIYQYLHRRDGSYAFPYVSPGCEGILRMTPEQIMAEPHLVFEMVHEEDSARMAKSIQLSYETLSGFEFEGRINTKEGLRWIRAVSSPELLDNGDVIFNGLLTDVTDQKLAETEIKKLNADLSERVENLASVNKELELLTRKLEIAFDAALEASKLKSEFVANISHEIRTPISAVIGMSELLLDTSLTDEQKQFTNMVRDSAQSLLTIINDILDFSKVEAGRLDLDIVSFEILSLVEDSAELLAPTARKNSLNLLTLVDPNLPATVMGDPVRIRQILINLISNAVKFTREGEVFVNVEQLEDEEDVVTLRFTVRDTGIGISEEARKRLFSPFVQADGSTTRKYGGTGLGLSISKLLAEMMEGELDFVSEEGIGSSFWFTAPMIKIPPPEGSSLSVAASQTQTVLLDSPEPPAAVTVLTASNTVELILKRYLGCMSLTPVVVAEVEQLSISRDRQHFLIIDSDSVGSVVAGVYRPYPQALQVIRELSALPNVTILFLGVKEDVVSHFVAPEHKDRHLLLLKPFHLAELVSICAKLALHSAPFVREQATSGAYRIAGDRRTGEKSQPAVKVYDAGPQVLIAEDNNVMQEVALRQLQKLGLTVTVVSNGVAAVDAVRTGQYALVFMDCQMPEMDGYEATLCIRKEEAARGGHIPIIAMTASAMKGDRENCIAAGMDDYLSKPVNQEQLALLLEKWLPSLDSSNLSRGGLKRQEPGQFEPSDLGNESIAIVDAEDISPKPKMDFAQLEKLYGDIGLPHLIDSFLVEARELLDEMAVNLEVDNMLEVARLAHQLKGLSVVMTAADLASLAIKLEKEAKNDGRERADQLRLELEEELKKIAAAIAERK